MESRWRMENGFYRKTVLWVILLLTGFSCDNFSIHKKHLVHERPNIVFVLVDDLGWNDVGFMGSSYFETTNLDKFAKESIVFENAYSGAPNGMSSRICLMSGMYDLNTEVRNRTESLRIEKLVGDSDLVSNFTFLEDSAYTMAEMLKDAGYVTGMFGKWQLSHDPTTQGFDVNVGGGIESSPKSYFAPYQNLDIQAPEGECLTDRLTDEALRFVENNQNNLFFLYLPFYAVHTPIQGKQAIIKKYRQKREEENQNNPSYASMVEVVDYNIGRLLNKINELGLYKNTLVVFTSDNGGISAFSKQNPLRAAKGSCFEGGVRVPMAIRWPGKIKPRRSDMPVVNLDFFPTFMNLTQGTHPNAQALDGTDISEFLLDNKALKERPILFYSPGVLQTNEKGECLDRLLDEESEASVRLGDWKLHYSLESKETLLFNLKDDIGENDDLSVVYPEKTNELKRILEAWVNDKNRRNFNSAGLNF
ncbi:Arylsulfatase A [Mariniphaga anaerophila]|uniref:Arylsulfatase A n=1 Tax=Mariniphaga anaerophila TaxID=1484053 RepID=A0A1M4V895_9BACT|nr:sulfatase [Mariniphaga anaerophila]SHE65211.1 Arylsulfatase A [Mariniphaga anaerophila]